MNAETTVACCLLLASLEAAAGDFVKPILVSVRPMTSGCIDLAWVPSVGGDVGFSGLNHFSLVSDSGQPERFLVSPNPFHRECGLQADTAFRFQICATYESTDSDNKECSDWSDAVRTPPAETGTAPAPPPPAPVIVSRDQGDTWIGIRWEAGHKYDSYFVNTSETNAPGLPRNTRTTHHDSEGNWGYQKIEGLQPGRTYYFEVQGCTETWFGIGSDHCCGLVARVLREHAAAAATTGSEHLHFGFRVARGIARRPGVRYARRAGRQHPE